MMISRRCLTRKIISLFPEKIVYDDKNNIRIVLFVCGVAAVVALVTRRRRSDFCFAGVTGLC
jgi:hypothetical protein